MRHSESSNPLEESQARGSEKRRYARPAIIERQRVEAMAAECSFPGGKSDPTCAVGFS
ncbi:MAG: hypothetical protein AAF725_22345 [Acidobacteriota bacterium]